MGGVDCGEKRGTKELSERECKEGGVQLSVGRKNGEQGKMRRWTG